MAAHRIPYQATASIGYAEDLFKKVKKAKDIRGTRFFHVYAPCPAGWKSRPEDTIKLARLAVQTGIFPHLRNGKRRELHPEYQGQGAQAGQGLHPAAGPLPPPDRGRGPAHPGRRGRALGATHQDVRRIKGSKKGRWGWCPRITAGACAPTSGRRQPPR